MPTTSYRTPVKTLAPQDGPAPGKPLAPRARHGRGRRLPPETLTDDEIRRLMAACGGDKPVPTRNRALIALLYRAGVRVSEALNLYPKDVDLDAGAVRVLNGKGDGPLPGPHRSLPGHPSHAEPNVAARGGRRQSPLRLIGSLILAPIPHRQNPAIGYRSPVAR